MSWGFQPLLAGGAQLLATVSIAADAGIFALTGQDTGLPTYRLTAECGTFKFTGRLFNQPVTPGSTVKLVTLGDSIVQFADFATSALRLDNQADGEIHWVKARGKAGFRHDNYYSPTARWIRTSDGSAWASAPLQNGANQGRASDWATGVKRRTTAVINMNPDIVVLNIGTNNGPTEDDNITASTVIAEINAIVAALAGTAKPNGNGIIRLVLGTIRPRAVTAAASGTFSIEIRPADRTRIETINAHIRTLDNDSTIYVWDPEPDLLDPNPTAPLLAGSCFRWVVRDGVHLAPRGAFAGARTLELTLDRILKDGTWFDPDATVTNAITNGVLAGTAGTVSTGVTGTAPSNTTIVNSAGSGIVTTTSTALENGWKIAVSSIGGSSSSSNTNVVRCESANVTVATQGWTSSTWVKLYAEVEVSNGAVLGALSMALMQGSTIRAFGLGATISNRATEAFANEPRSGWIETYPQQVDTATTLKARIDIEPYIDRAGDCVVTVKRWIMREVEAPATTFPYDPMNPQVYGLAGQQVGLDRVPALPADAGVIGVSGQAVNLILGKALSAATAHFVALSAERSPLVDEQGGYLIDEQGAVLVADDPAGEMQFEVGRQLTADVGAFAFAGQEAALIFQGDGVYAIAADVGAFTLDGQVAALAGQITIVLDAGLFAVTAGDTPLMKFLVPLTADQGAFLLNGQAVEFIRPFLPEVGLFQVSGTADLNVVRRRVYVRFGPLVRTPRLVHPGATVEINGAFNDEVDFPFDPLETVLKIASPRGQWRSYTYGDDIEIEKTADGRYLFNLEADMPGRWEWQWRVLCKDVVSVKEGHFYVQTSPLYEQPNQAYIG